MSSNWANRTMWTGALIAVVVMGYLPITWTMVLMGDFPLHIGYTLALAQGELTLPHILVHALTLSGILLGLTAPTAMIVVMLGCQAMAAWGVSWLAQRSGASVGIAMCLGICVVFVAPIVPLAVAADADLSPAGYFLPNILHSPTMIAAKAFVPFLIALGVIASGVASVAWSSVWIAVIVLLAGLAKPHYVSCLVPVVVVASAWQWWLGRLASWRPSLSFALASVAVLIWTVIGTTALAGGGTAVLAPLVVVRSAGDGVSVDVVSIAIRACSDLAFPLAVLVLWPAACRFPVLVFAWAAYGIGLGQGLLLAESGDRLDHGNFLWSPRLATFGVMAASAAWVGRSSAPWNWRAIIAWSVLVLHVAYGAWWISARVEAGQGDLLRLPQVQQVS